MKNSNLLVSSPSFGRYHEGSWSALEREGFKLWDFRDIAGLESPAYWQAAGKAAFMIMGNTPFVGREFLERMPQLRVIAKAGVGLDNLDVDAATEKGVLVFNQAGANADAVADYAFGLMLALARRIVDAHNVVAAGDWQKLMGVNVFGKTLGLLGFGSIARAMARRAAGFSMRVITCSRSPIGENHIADGVRQVSLEQMLKQADIISLHVPLTEATKGLISEREFSLMKPDALLVNTARGKVVDQDALFTALKEKRIRGAALDAFAKEPLGESPLSGLDNVVLSPHTAWASRESTRRMDQLMVEGLTGLIKGKLPLSVVNPEVAESFSL